MVNARLREVLASDGIKLFIIIFSFGLVLIGFWIINGILQWIYQENFYYGVQVGGQNAMLPFVIVAIIITVLLLVGFGVSLVLLSTYVSKRFGLSPERSDNQRIIKIIAQIGSAVLGIIVVWLVYGFVYFDIVSLVSQASNFEYFFANLFFLVMAWVLIPLIFAYLAVLVVDVVFYFQRKIQDLAFQPTRFDDVDSGEDTVYKGIIKFLFIAFIIVCSIFIVKQTFRPYSIVKFDMNQLTYPAAYDGSAFTGNETITFTNFTCVYANAFNSTGYPISFGVETRQIFENPQTMPNQAFIFKVPRGYYVPMYLIGGSYQYNSTEPVVTFIAIGFVGYTSILPTMIDPAWKTGFLTKFVGITFLNATYLGGVLTIGYMGSTNVDMFNLVDFLFF